MQFHSSLSSSSDPVADLACGYVDSMAALLSLCGYQKLFRSGASLHAAIIKTQTFINSTTTHPRHSLILWNSLLSMYSKLNHFSSASMVFADMPFKDTVSCNTILSTYSSSSAFTFFKQMRSSPTYPLNSATFTTLLSSSSSSPVTTTAIHSLSFPTGFHHHTTVCNSLITSYFIHGFPTSSLRVFQELPKKNVVSWTAMVSGFSRSDTSYSKSLLFFKSMRREAMVVPNPLTYLSALTACTTGKALREGRQLHGVIVKLGLYSDVCLESALMDMYSKNGFMEGAFKVFENAEKVDEISITVILTGLSKNGMEDEARRVFCKAVSSGMKIDETMAAAVLVVCTAEASINVGRGIHGLVVKKALEYSVFVCNGLVTMYGRYGEAVESRKVFEEMGEKNTVSWNAMIGAYSRSGEGKKAMETYEEMVKKGVRPTEVTFVSLLQACSHGGRVEEGVGVMEEMRRVYGIEGRGEHYACVVDMVGRRGLVEEAEEVAEGVGGRRVWEALMGVCGMHGEGEVGRRAAEELWRVCPESEMAYVVIGRMCGGEGRSWSMRRMREKGLKKSVGMSCIQVEKEMHSFVVGDNERHPRFLDIRSVLMLLVKVMKARGDDEDDDSCLQG